MLTGINGIQNASICRIYCIFCDRIIRHSNFWVTTKIECIQIRYLTIRNNTIRSKLYIRFYIQQPSITLHCKNTTHSRLVAL